MAFEYWKKVGARLSSLGKAAINAAIPAVVIASINSAYEVIEKKLHQLYFKTIRNSSITLALNTAGVLILIFQPFGKNIAKWISLFFFFSSFVFWLVRMIIYCRNYGRVTFYIGKNVLKKRSLSKGISQFIIDEYPLVTFTYAGIDIAANHFSALDEFPRLNELVKLFIQNFWKRVVLFAGIMTFYTVIVYWVIKPVIIRSYL